MAQRDTSTTATDWRDDLLAGVTRQAAGPAAPNRLGWSHYDGRPALWWGTGPVEGVDAVVVAWDFTTHGGSFGEADADAFTAAARAATASRRPLVTLIRSGGTRLQEGVAGLVGLARVALALGDLAAAGVAHLAVADQPTTGGMWVTVGSRADLRCAVLGATVGFAGPRVVAAVTGELPPADSHTAAAARAAGLVDAALPPSAVRGWLRRALRAVAPPVRLPAGDPAGLPEVARSDAAATASAGSARTGWEQVLVTRHGQRRDAGAILDDLLPDGVDLNGPDQTVRARVGQLATGDATGRTPGGPAVVGVALATERGGAPGPDGYRLLTRAAELAGKLGLPLVTLVDTPGAACGPAAEAAGVAAQIGTAMAAVLACPSPTISVVVGEGGSGGALAACCTDVVLISPDGYLTALSPEGAATTLRLDPAEAADRAGLRPTDLLALGFADAVLDPGDADLPGLARRVTNQLADLTLCQRDVRLGARKGKWSTGLDGFK